MILTEREIKTLITNCRLVIEERYRGKLDDDEYFKRGFLLACNEMSIEMINKLKEYKVQTYEKQ